MATKKKSKKSKASKTKAKKSAKKATKKTLKKKSKKMTAKAKKSAVKAKKKATSKKTTAKTSRKISASKSKSASVQPKHKPATATETTNTKTYKLNQGDMAPSFSLLDQTGRTVSLEEFRGKTVVLYFYPKDDTPGCTKEACSFRDNIEQFLNKDAVILGVSADDAESHQAFVQKYGLNFTLLADTDKKVSEAYGVWVEKNMYGKTYMGIERTTFIIGANGQIIEIFRQVKVDGHTEQVLDVLAKSA